MMWKMSHFKHRITLWDHNTCSRFCRLVLCRRTHVHAKSTPHKVSSPGKFMGIFTVKLKWNGKTGEGHKIDVLLPFLYYRKWKSTWNSIVKRDSSVVSLFAYLGKHIHRFTFIAENELIHLLAMLSLIRGGGGSVIFLEEKFSVNTSVIKWCEGWICYWVWWKVRAAAPGVAEEYIAFHMKGKHVRGGGGVFLGSFVLHGVDHMTIMARCESLWYYRMSQKKLQSDFPHQ